MQTREGSDRLLLNNPKSRLRAACTTRSLAHPITTAGDAFRLAVMRVQRRLPPRRRLSVDVESHQPDRHAGGEDRDDPIPVASLALSESERKEGKNALPGEPGHRQIRQVTIVQPVTHEGEGVEPDQPPRIAQLVRSRQSEPRSSSMRRCSSRFFFSLRRSRALRSSAGGSVTMVRKARPTLLACCQTILAR
jgi:hypothetical protein